MGTWFLKAGVLLVSLIGMFEFYRAVKIEEKSITCIGYAGAVMYLLLIDKIYDSGFLVVFSILILSVLIFLILKHKVYNIYDGALTLFGFFYVCFLISFIILTRDYKDGIYFVWLIFISAWGSDTGAYFAGKLFGKHKLTPELSPNKTVEGAIGGIFLATLVSFAYGYIISNLNLFSENYFIVFCTIIAFLGSIFSQIGDLVASSIKRYTKIKDFGTIIPGHGGVLDRFDSILFTSPIVYAVLIALSKLTRIT